MTEKLQKDYMYYVILVLIIALDQITKYFIRTGMSLNESIAVVDNIFHITYIHNYGAAFSMFEGSRMFLIAVTGILLVVMLIFMIVASRGKHWTLQLSLAMIIAGGIGNFIDRMRYGYVVDFFDFRIWPIFNVADISVCTGCALLAVFVILIDGKRDGSSNDQNMPETTDEER